MENVRDLIAKQVLFGSPQALDVDMLHHHLQSRVNGVRSARETQLRQIYSGSTQCRIVKEKKFHKKLADQYSVQERRK